MPEELLTVKEVAERLRCSLSSVYKLFEAGDLRGFRLHGKRGGVRIHSASIQEMMERNANGTPAAPPSLPELLPKKPRRGRPRKILHVDELAVLEPPRRAS